MRERLLAALALVGAPACLGSDLPELGTSDEADTAPLEIMPARGIEIAAIEVNQGLEVRVDDGGYIDPAKRPIALIAGREALVRVHHRVDPDWAPRDIEARLTIESAGTSEQLTEVRTIIADNDPSQLDSGFTFELDATRTTPDARYRLELWETGDPAALDAVERTWASPSEGTAPIGFDGQALVMKVVFVPILVADAATTSTFDELDLAPLVDSLYEQNPTHAIEASLREAIVIPDQVLDLGELLPILSETRTADAVADNVYYHGILEYEAPSLADRRGMANIVGPEPGEAAMRVGVTVFWAPDPSLAAATFNHELGHNQGLQHVLCPNSEADGLATDYPHINGWIGAWGWGLVRRQLFAPDDAYDYMSYCEPSWVSDWTWSLARERIATLTSWDMAAPAAPHGWLLLGAPSAKGMHWWVAPGRVGPSRARAADRIELELGSGERLELPLVEIEQSEGGRGWLVAELPTTQAIRSLVHRDALGERRSIALD